MSSILDTTQTDAEEFMALAPKDWPDVEHLITEDDAPVDNVFSEKQQRLLAECLYTSWQGPGNGRPFLAMANVGMFYAVSQPAFVPHVLLSLDVHAPADLWSKMNRSYLIWVYGKPPEVVIEIVSNRKGGEHSDKLQAYARIGIPYYVIFDPDRQLSDQVLRIFALYVGSYAEKQEQWFPLVQLGLTLWHGTYEGVEETWLRWCDHDGHIIPTGAERANHAEQRADHAEQRAEQERERAERLAARLRELGIDPEA